MIVKQEEQIEALSGILAQQMLEPNYKVRKYTSLLFIQACMQAPIRVLVLTDINRVVSFARKFNYCYSLVTSCLHLPLHSIF